MEEFKNFESEEKKFLKRTFKKIFSKVLIFFLFFLFFLSIGFVIYQTYFKANKIEILVQSPATVLAGEKFKIETKIVNHSPFPLNDASLKLILPEDSRTSDFKKEKFVSKFLGDVSKKSEIKTDFSLRLFGPSSKIKVLKLVLSWEKPGFKINFKKEKEVKIEISEPMVGLDFFTPKEVLPETEFSFSLKYQNNSSKFLKNLVIKFSFPEDFKIIETSPKLNGNLFLVKEISPFEIRKIDLKGKFSSFVSEKKNIPLVAEISFLREDENILIERKEGNVILVPSPLALKILPSFDEKKPIRLGQTLRFKIYYQNNTQIALKNLVVKAKIDSNLFDYKTLKTDGEFSLRKKEITWLEALKESLKTLSPSQQDFVEFEISLKKEFVPKTEDDFNKTIEIESEITTLTVPYYLQAKKLISKAKVSFKLQTKTELICKALFYDASSGILNQGPFPPKVDKTTNFTIHWEIKNYFNDLENVEIRTFLPENVVSTGIFKTNTSFEPIYNERTKELVWRLEKIEKGAGVIKEKPYLIFQIALTPSPVQKGRFVNLENEVVFSGIDNFTSKEVYTTCDPILTGDLWKYDFKIQPGKGIVEE